jgi:hypothetical protein
MAVPPRKRLALLHHVLNTIRYGEGRGFGAWRPTGAMTQRASRQLPYSLRPPARVVADGRPGQRGGAEGRHAVAQGGERIRLAAGLHRASALAQDHIAHTVPAVFDTPLCALHCSRRRRA